MKSEEGEGGASEAPGLLEKKLSKHSLLPNIRTLIVSVVLTIVALKYFPIS